MARTRSPWLGPASRPVAIPYDLDDPSLERASGVIELPLHIVWSEPCLTYDMNRREDRLRVYEQVLREGTEDDVDEFARVFDELVPSTFGRPGQHGSAAATQGLCEC